MHYYTAYGLGIQSELLLPELGESPSKIDVSIRLGKIQPALAANARGPHWSWAGSDQVMLYWEQVGSFLIKNGREIIVDPDPAAADNRVRLFLLGAAIGVLLHQRGLTVLHGSAIALNGGAVAFLGWKGWGKSTMAATLHNQGYHVLADDVIAIDSTPNGPCVVPGFPQLKLWPDALQSIGQAVEPLPRLHPELEKRDYRLTSGFWTRPIPLNRIYLLGHGPEPAIEAIPANQALLELLPHWYCGRFSDQVLESLGRANQFLQCASLAKQVPVFHLNRPRSLVSLSEVAELVKEHCTPVPQQTV